MLPKPGTPRVERSETRGSSRTDAREDKAELEKGVSLFFPYAFDPPCQRKLYPCLEFRAISNDQNPGSSLSYILTVRVRDSKLGSSSFNISIGLPADARLQYPIVRNVASLRDVTISDSERFHAEAVKNRLHSGTRSIDLILNFVSNRNAYEPLFALLEKDFEISRVGLFHPGTESLRYD